VETTGLCSGFIVARVFGSCMCTVDLASWLVDPDVSASTVMPVTIPPPSQSQLTKNNTSKCRLNLAVKHKLAMHVRVPLKEPELLLLPHYEIV
jgi:hypothetical protein